MYRAIPVGNKLCAARTRELQEERRRAHMRDVRPLIDTRPPKSLQFKRQTNGKKDELQRQRYEAIEEENRRILFRMHEEYQKPPRYLEKSFSLPQVRGPGDPTPQRRREVEHIAKENLLLLHRIQTMKPGITSNADLAVRQKQHKEYLRLKCEYPLVSFSSRQKPMSQFQRTADILLPDAASQLRAHPHAQVGGVASDQAAVAAQSSKSQKARDGMTNGGTDGSGQPAEEELGVQYIFSEEMKLGDVVVQVEMVSDGRVLAISTFDLAAEKSYELLLSEANHVALHDEVEGDYGKIAQRLRIVDGQLVLDPPKGAE
mmetsp:Transcript_27988/g.50959  ORF Transcript_27988/g.50959 Transcript_27988/m.50959 type:complete len:316 (-) Transcript_27988:79-1026(-)